MDWPISYGNGYSQTVYLGGSFNSGVANVKGTYGVISSSTAFDADGVLLSIGQPNSIVSGLVDFSIGSTGSEQIVCADILSGGSARMATNMFLPISIPAGTQIQTRVQDSVGGGAWPVRVMLLRGGFWHPPMGHKIITLGAVTATSKGTQIDPGAVGSTYGAWSQITASTTDDIAALTFRVSGQANAAPSDSALQFYIDIGVGGSGSEVAVIDGFGFGSQSSGWYGPNPTIWFPAGIPAGTRISARARSNITDATDRLFGVALHGLVI